MSSFDKNYSRQAWLFPFNDEGTGLWGEGS
jgi:hypothetical protein